MPKVDVKVLFSCEVKVTFQRSNAFQNYKKSKSELRILFLLLMSNLLAFHKPCS